jgi:hypothetical protein
MNDTIVGVFIIIGLVAFFGWNIYASIHNGTVDAIRREKEAGRLPPSDEDEALQADLRPSSMGRRRALPSNL